MIHDGAAAPAFFCPLTMAIMKDPVQDREGMFRVAASFDNVPSMCREIVLHIVGVPHPPQRILFIISYIYTIYWTVPSPVLNAGHSYEKSAILQWLAKNQTSPITRNRLSRKHLVPNRALKEAINFEGDFFFPSCCS